jgi:hypothetical protein
MAANALANAQELSIELSVKWAKEKSELNIHPFAPNDTVRFPILKFTYRNLAGEDIYFRNIYLYKQAYPKVVVASLTNTEMDLSDRAKVHASYKGKSYQVEISESWEVYEQGFDTSKEHELHVINDDLWAIYTVLETQQSLNELVLQKQLSSFGYSDKEFVSYKVARRLIFAEREKKGLAKSEEVHFPNRPLTEYEIRGEYEDQFIFLKAGETYEREVNLIGFYLLGGSYEFVISNGSLYGYIINKDGQRIKLPKLVDGYQLYEGDFLTNVVGIQIN